MKIKDKDLNVFVDVCDKDCLTRICYWPRENPGTFVQGRGYQGGNKEWICGTRQIHGCPDEAFKEAES